MKIRPEGPNKFEIHLKVYWLNINSFHWNNINFKTKKE